MLTSDTFILGKGNYMSAQFGRWNFEGQAPAPDYIEKVGAILGPYGPDSNESYSKGGVRSTLSRLPHHEGIASREAAAYFFLRSRDHLGRPLGQSC